MPGCFDTKLKKFNQISPVELPPQMAASFLKSATHGNSELLSAWAACKTVPQNASPGTIPTYDLYFEYLMFHAKQLEAAITDNTTSRKANAAESDYLLPYSHTDECYNNDTELSSYMVDQGGDVDMIQGVLQCNQAMKQGKPCLPPRTRREPIRKELQTKDPIWSELKSDTRQVGIQTTALLVTL